jgi:hypothetical protein
MNNYKQQNIGGWKLPYCIIIAAVIFAVVNSISILSVRGIADSEGYRWGASEYVPINKYENDGQISVYFALGYSKDSSNKFSYLFNMGGPSVHIARVLLWLGDKIGIIKKIDDPYAYYLYPEEYLKIWKFFGLYKVWVFLIWLPIVIYWIGSRHFSEATGIIASWLVVAIPFITGFEPRNKPDSIAIITGLFSILWQMEYVRDRRFKYLLLAAACMGFSFAVKPNMLPVFLTYITSYLVVASKEGQDFKSVKCWHNLLIAAGVAFFAFILSNPLIVKGLLVLSKDYLRFFRESGQHASISIVNILLSVWYRIIHFDSHFGKVLNLFVIPAMIFAVFGVFLKRGQRCMPHGILLLFLFGFFTFIAAAVQERVIFITYYYYPAAIVILILIADLLATIWIKAKSSGRIAALGAGIIVIFIITAAAYENFRVLNYMTSKTNRQEMYDWFEKNIPQGTVVGIPMSPSHTFFDQWTRLDPFKYRLVHIGKQGELLEENKPDYFIWILFSKDSPKINRPDYKIIAEFSKGADLPHERYDLYQEEQFIVYKKNSAEADISKRSILGEMERQLGAFMKADSEDEFRILQFQGITFMPLWLNLLRKTDYSLHYDSHSSFDSSVKGDNLEHSRYLYVHNIGPTTLQLWGVKYILARLTPNSSFEDMVLRSDRYSLKEINRFKTLFGEEKRDVGLFYNNEYKGQVFFAKYGEGESKRKPFYKRIWESIFNRKKTVQGVLYDSDKIKRMGANNIAVYMKVKSSAPAIITVRGGGKEESWDIAEGVQTVWMPYRIFNPDEPVVYEINPLKKRGKIYVEEVYARPLFLYSDQAISNAKISKRGGTISVNVDADGEIIFSLPYHKYWRAEVDGKMAIVNKGLAGTIAVKVSKGEHFIKVYLQ